jgi:hypothetical protein
MKEIYFIIIYLNCKWVCTRWQWYYNKTTQIAHITQNVTPHSNKHSTRNYINTKGHTTLIWLKLHFENCVHKKHKNKRSDPLSPSPNISVREPLNRTWLNVTRNLLHGKQLTLILLHLIQEIIAI